MNITEEAVEAACIAGTANYINYPEDVKDLIRAGMRRVLEAAAPFIIWEL